MTLALEFHLDAEILGEFRYSKIKAGQSIRAWESLGMDPWLHPSLAGQEPQANRIRPVLVDQANQMEYWELRAANRQG